MPGGGAMKPDGGGGGGGGAAPFQVNDAGTAIIPLDNGDSLVIGSDRMVRDPADASKDIRAFFDKVKGAFRAGHVTGDHWDDANVGNASFATGLEVIAKGLYSHAEGAYSQALGDRSHAEGSNTRALAIASHAEGQAAVARYQSQHAHASGHFAVEGDAQRVSWVLRNETADATPLLLTANAADAASLTGNFINVPVLPASRAMQMRISVVARRTDVQGEMAGWTWEGLVGRDATGNARIIGNPVVAAWGDAPATDSWGFAVSVNTADAVNNYLALMATGQAGKTIRWVANLDWVEVSS